MGLCVPPLMRTVDGPSACNNASITVCSTKLQLPAEPTALPETIRVQDIVPCVLELHTYHADLKGVTCIMGEATDPEPICVRPSALLRSLLVLLGLG